jgi:hypothetical protein
MYFNKKNCYVTLNQNLKRLNKLKDKLLLVLKRPDIPIHTNGSESDIRYFVKKRKVSGGQGNRIKIFVAVSASNHYPNLPFAA